MKYKKKLKFFENEQNLKSVSNDTAIMSNFLYKCTEQAQITL